MSGNGDRYVVKHLAFFDGSLRNYGIDDLAYTQDSLIRDWRKKGRKRPVWLGTKEEAEHVCRELNSGAFKVPAPDADEQALRAIVKAQQRKRSRVASAAAPALAPKFYICNRCGKAVKESHECKG